MANLSDFFPQAQPTPLAQPQAQAPVPPPQQAPMPLAPQPPQAQAPAAAGPFSPKPPTPSWHKATVNGRDVLMDANTGITRDIGPHVSDKEKPTYDQLLKEVSNTANDLLDLYKKHPEVDQPSQRELYHQYSNYAEPGFARLVQEEAPDWLSKGMGNVGLPSGTVNPIYSRAATDIGLLKTKLLGVYSSGRQSIWMTKFMKQHLPSETFPKQANIDRINTLMATGMLKRAVDQGMLDDLGKMPPPSPVEQEALKRYKSRGMDDQEALAQIYVDRVVFGDKAADTLPGGRIE